MEKIIAVHHGGSATLDKLNGMLESGEWRIKETIKDKHAGLMVWVQKTEPSFKEYEALSVSSTAFWNNSVDDEVWNHV